MSFSVKFWGTRGSIACPSPDHIKYGGNTTCIEVNVGGRRFVLDAGTGIRVLGKEYLRTDVKVFHLLLTHTHWDHINGFPFFEPAYAKDRSIHIMAGNLDPAHGGVKAVLAGQMNNPTFPVPMEAMAASLEFDDFEAGSDFHLYPDVLVRTEPLNHPNGATGYRIEFEGKSFCFVTDTEHFPDRMDENVLRLIEGADMVVYDTTYTEEEYPNHVGWGHSTWNEGVKLCREADAKQLILFHHEPCHTDEVMDRLEREAQAEWSDTIAAREGMVLEVG